MTESQERLSELNGAHESMEVVLSSPESCGSSAGTLSALRSLRPLTHSSMRLSPATMYVRCLRPLARIDVHAHWNQ